MPSTFLTAEWKNLVMVNYEVDPALLEPYLPNKTALDVFDGKTFVSLVGFMFMNTRVLGFKIPFHVNFEEVNLRFYVRYQDNGVWKRGTVFIKEIVPKPAISFVANTIYHEKYVTKKMKHTVRETASELDLGYYWKHNNKWNSIQAIVEKPAMPMKSGSEEEFITEHYWGYSKYSDSTTFEYHVQHPSWNVFPVKHYHVDCDFGALYGDHFAALTMTRPASVLVAEGSVVSVLKKRNL